MNADFKYVYFCDICNEPRHYQYGRWAMEFKIIPGFCKCKNPSIPIYTKRMSGIHLKLLLSKTDFAVINL